MTISSYATLQTAVANWLGKPTDTDVTANVADFIALAETDIRTDLNTSAMETFSSSMSITSEYFTLSTLSSQITEIERIYITSTTPYVPLTYATPQQILVDFPDGTTGQPTEYTISSQRLQFRKIPATTYTAHITYRKWFDPLATTSTNTLLTNWPNIYLYGALRHGAIFLEDFDLADRYAADYMKQVKAIERADDRLNFPATALMIRTDTGSP